MFLNDRAHQGQPQARTGYTACLLTSIKFFPYSLDLCLRNSWTSIGHLDHDIAAIIESPYLDRVSRGSKLGRIVHQVVDR